MFHKEVLLEDMCGGILLGSRPNPVLPQRRVVEMAILKLLVVLLRPPAVGS